MATPAQLLGQLAQQFEAAGNPQLAQQFRNMAGGGVPPTMSRFGGPGGIRVGASPPTGQMAGQLTSPLLGGQPSSMFRPPRQLGPAPGPAGWRELGGMPQMQGPAATRAARSGAGIQQVLGGQLGPFGQGGAPYSSTAAGRSGIPMPRRAASSLVQSMGSPYANPADALARQNAALRGLSSQIGGGPVGRPGPAPTSTLPRTYGSTLAGDSLAPRPGGGPGQMPRGGRPFASPGAATPLTGRGPGAALGAAARKMSQTPTTAAAAGQFGVAAGAAPPTYLEAKTGLSNWSKTLRNPFRIFNDTKALYLGKAPTGAGLFARGVASGAGSTLMAAGRMSTAPMLVAFIGDGIGVNDWFEQGGWWDTAAEGALVGASFGAFGGGPAAAIGAALGMAVNTITDGGLVKVAQNIPWIGQEFGPTKGEMDVRGVAKNFFAKSAAAQGNPEAAAVAESIFDSYYKMIEAGILPPGSEFEYMMMSGRQAGLTGFPWTPEAIVPVYSPDDLAKITGMVSEELQPMYDIAEGLLQQDFAHIQDDDLRGRLIESAQSAGGSLMESFGASMLGPTTAAILTESQRRTSNEALGGQLGANDDFAAMFADASGF